MLKKCDRCKRFYEFYRSIKTKNCVDDGIIEVYVKPEDGYYIRQQQYDLCPDCMRELQEFLKKEN